MVHSIKWSLRARKDLTTIKDFISKDSAFYAETLVIQIVQRTEILLKHPETGQPVFPEKFKHLRKLLYKSYRIIYHFSGDDVTIITVHHQSRLIENIPQIKGYKE